MEEVVQPAMTVAAAGVAAGRLGRAAGGFGHAAGRFGHAAGGLGGAAGRLAASAHVAPPAEGLSVLAETRDRTGDQQQREQNLGFHSGGSPKGSRILARPTALGVACHARGTCYCKPSSKRAACVSRASCVRFLQNASFAAQVAKRAREPPVWTAERHCTAIFRFNPLVQREPAQSLEPEPTRVLRLCKCVGVRLGRGAVARSTRTFWRRAN